jgi:uncharacterized protein YegJ (DUF2314 family)
MDRLDDRMMEEIKQRNRNAKEAERSKAAERAGNKDERTESIAEAGYIEARFHAQDGTDELVWLKVIKVMDGKVQGAIYRKPEKVKFNIGESVVVRFKDIVDTRRKINGPITEELKKYFPL